jgi:hypothetical protein
MSYSPEPPMTPITCCVLMVCAPPWAGPCAGTCACRVAGSRAPCAACRAAGERGSALLPGPLPRDRRAARGRACRRAGRDEAGPRRAFAVCAALGGARGRLLLEEAPRQARHEQRRVGSARQLEAEDQLLRVVRADSHAQAPRPHDQLAVLALEQEAAQAVDAELARLQPWSLSTSVSSCFWRACLTSASSAPGRRKTLVHARVARQLGARESQATLEARPRTCARVPA